MDTIRIGFIGSGRHSGMRIYPALKDAGLDLVAICDVDQQKARARAAEYGVRHVYGDHLEMCNKHDLDGVLVVTGPQGHYELTKSLLELGLHVWTEKPCSVTSQQADELVQLAKQTGRIVQTGFNYRYAMGVQIAVDLIESGQFASPANISVRWWLGEPDTFRFMQHYVCHAVDLLHYLTPGGLAHSMDMHIEYQRQDNFDWFMVTFRGNSGCIAVLDLGAHMGGQCHFSRVDLSSGDGMLSVRDFTELTHYDTAPWGNLIKPDSKVYRGDRVLRTEPLLTRGSFSKIWGYVAELERFREAVQGSRPPQATIQEAAWGMHVMDKLMKAANCSGA